MNIDIRKILLIGLFFSLALLIYYLTPLKRGISFIFDAPMQTAIRQSASINSALAYQRLTKNQLIQKIKKLEGDVNKRAYDIIQHEELKKENANLRALLDFKNETSEQLILANITQKINSQVEKVVIINKGAADGIQIGNAVIIDDGTIIGRIDFVTMDSSRVLLTIDPKSHILATLLGTDNTITGVLIGTAQSSLVLDLVPKNIPIQPDHIVITNGLQDSIPAHLFAGEVTQLEESENEIFNQAFVKPPYIIEDLTTVGVIITHTEKNP